MIFNTTRTNKETDRLIKLAVGKAFGLIEVLKRKGVGSEPFTIVSGSDQFELDFTANAYDLKCNIELRPKGIILHYSKKYSKYVWVIPYHHLTVYQNGRLISIYGDQLKMKVTPRFWKKKNSPFIQKLLRYKAEYMGQID